MIISIVLPIYNEEESLDILFDEIAKVMQENNFDYEIIAVNDGSQDGSLKKLKDKASKNILIKVIDFSRNFGQTAALSAGFEAASGEIIIPMDADLQNDPKDIPALIKKMNEGFDVVSGWRKNRRDKLLSRKIPSWIANALISRITRVNLHDYGCTLKAYRANIIKDVKLYGEMHRFIPALAVWHGAKITEIVTKHRERKFGQTKYGISRTIRVILDLLTVKFLTKYSTRPMHFFGGVGFISIILGVIAFIIALYLKFYSATSLIQTPLPLIGVFFSIVGVQLILMGLLAEMIMRNYFELGDRKIYKIRERINF